LESGSVRVLADVHDSLAKRFMTSCWVAMAGYVASHRDVIRRFAGVMKESLVYCNAHHAETVDILAAYTGLDARTITRSTRRVFATTADPSELQPVVDAAVRYKVLAKGFRAAELVSPAVADIFR
jgi:ABC-type nitrate/sulfonate/bicarbonate transport system substrate-binding protein